jgi:hypothetical protein
MVLGLGAYAAHRMLSSSMAGLCGTADLGRLREIRREITENQSAGRIENYECEDSSDELFVGAQAEQKFDCDRMARDVERELGSSLRHPDAMDENSTGAGPYVDAGDLRLHFFCLGDEVELTEVPLALRQLNRQGRIPPVADLRRFLRSPCGGRRTSARSDR